MQIVIKLESRVAHTVLSINTSPDVIQHWILYYTDSLVRKKEARLLFFLYCIHSTDWPASVFADFVLQDKL